MVYGYEMNTVVRWVFPLNMFSAYSELLMMITGLKYV